LSDEEWAVIEAAIGSICMRGARPRSDTRGSVDAMVFKFRTGLPWRDLPEDLQPWRRQWQLFDRWTERGVWDVILDALQACDPANGVAAVDGTIARAHQKASGAKKKSAETMGARIREAFSPDRREARSANASAARKAA